MNQSSFGKRGIGPAILRMVTAPFRQLARIAQIPGRGRALVFAVPALAATLICVSAFGWTQWISHEHLVQKYQNVVNEIDELEAEKKNEEKEKRMGSGDLATPQIEEDDATAGPDEEMREVLKRKLVILNKLIELEPNEEKHKYDLAIASLKLGGQYTSRASALLNQISPEDKPGYAEGHLWIAKQILVNKDRRFSRNVRHEIARKHYRNALESDSNNTIARNNLAILYYADRMYEEAEPYFAEIFKENVLVHKQLCVIYKKLGKEVELEDCINNAIVRLEAIVREDPENFSNVDTLLTMLAQRKSFEQAKDLLLKIEADSEDVRVKLQCRQRLSRVYVLWAGIHGLPPNVDDEDAYFEKLKISHQYQNNNPEVLSHLTLLGFEKSAVGEKARQIYNPVLETDPLVVDETAHPRVLEVLSQRLIAEDQSEDAIRVLEKVLAKIPQNTVSLNNLAYLLLNAEEPRPKRALELVNQAMSVARSQGRVLTRDWSHFLDTRGQAHRQLGNFNDAIRDFEEALRLRPQESALAYAIHDCYVQIDRPREAKAWKERADAIKAKQAPPK